MPQSVKRGQFVNAALFESCPEDLLERALGHRLSGERKVDLGTSWSREDEERVAMGDPILAQQLESPRREGDVAIFTTFPKADVNHLPRAIDIGNLKMGSLLQPQTTGVDRREAGPIALQPDEAKNLKNLIGTEDDRELLLAGRTNQIESGDVSVENLLEEELDATQGNGRGRAGEFLDILEKEKILSELFLRDQIWGFVKVLRELTHGPDVSLLRPFRKASELKRLDHSLS
jgi:hypothetical protein